jgi:hypothetical protein
MIKLLAEYDDELKVVVLDNDPGNASTSPQIWKEILDIVTCKTQKLIRHEIGDAKFCLTIDESRDGSAREQMTHVVRFVDKRVSFRDTFLILVRVHDTIELR